jgi:lipopolysaccharide biosynthesis glycosyltransferase
LDISLAYDEGYAYQAQVAIESILKHVDAGDDITFWIMTTREVHETGRNALQRQLDGRANMQLLDAGDLFRSLPVPADPAYHVGAGAYLRLMLPAAMPQHIKRTVYIDADVLCLGDLADLWDADIGEAPIGAVRDPFVPSIKSHGGLPGAGPEISATAPCFNSGVLLMNLRRWRDLQVTEKCFQYLADNREEVRYLDQDALNYTTSGEWYELDPKWNYMRTWRIEPTYRGVGRGEEIRIMHFTGPYKPWNGNFPKGVRRHLYESMTRQLDRRLQA